MSNKNLIIAKTVVDKLKKDQLIPLGENTIEDKIASGTVKDTDWKAIFIQQISEEENATKHEAE